VKTCSHKVCVRAQYIGGHEGLSIDALAKKLEPYCHLSREARREAIKAFRARVAKAPKAAVVKAKPYMTIDQEVAYMRKKGMAGSRAALREWVKANRARR
jgi:hypothetical protein